MFTEEYETYKEKTFKELLDENIRIKEQFLQLSKIIQRLRNRIDEMKADSGQPMGINELKEDVQNLLDEKGFKYGKDSFWEKATLAHTEISELADVIKKKGYEAQEEIEAEFADIIIRAMNFALMFDIDAEQAIKKKMTYNHKRPYMYNTVDED